MDTESITLTDELHESIEYIADSIDDAVSYTDGLQFDLECVMEGMNDLVEIYGNIIKELSNCFNLLSKLLHKKG